MPFVPTVRFILAAGLKRAWLDMFELPWQHTGADNGRGLHWLRWFAGWLWAFAGLFLGALIAPTLLRFAGLSASAVQGILVTCIVVFVAAIVQVVSFGWLVLPMTLTQFLSGGNRTFFAVFFEVFEATILPLGVLAITIHGFLDSVAPYQHSAVIAFAALFVVKGFMIQPAWGLVRSQVSRRFIEWLRGGKPKPRGA